MLIEHVYTSVAVSYTLIDCEVVHRLKEAVPFAAPRTSPHRISRITWVRVCARYKEKLPIKAFARRYNWSVKFTTISLRLTFKAQIHSWYNGGRGGACITANGEGRQRATGGSDFMEEMYPRIIINEYFTARVFRATVQWLLFRRCEAVAKSRAAQPIRDQSQNSDPHLLPAIVEQNRLSSRA